MQVIYSPLPRSSPINGPQAQMYYKSELDLQQQKSMNLPTSYEKRSITPNRDRPAFSQISHKNALHLNSGSKRRQNNSSHNLEQCAQIDLGQNPAIGSTFYPPLMNTSSCLMQSPLLYSDHLNPTFTSIPLPPTNNVSANYTFDSAIHSKPTNIHSIVPPLTSLAPNVSNLDYINANSRFVSGVDIMKGSGASENSLKVNAELEKKFASTEKLLKRVDDLLERSYANSSRKPDSFLENSSGAGNHHLKLASPGPVYNKIAEDGAYHKRAASTIDTPTNSNFILKKAGELLEETFRAGLETNKIINSMRPINIEQNPVEPRNLSPLGREPPVEANLPPKFNNPASIPVLYSPARVLPIVDPLKQNERVRALDMPLKTSPKSTASARKIVEIVEKSAENPYPTLVAISKRREFELDSRKAFQIFNSSDEASEQEVAKEPKKQLEEKLKPKNISTNEDRGSPTNRGAQVAAFESNNTPKFEQGLMLHSFRENSQRKEGPAAFYDPNEIKLKQLSEKIQFIEKGSGFEMTKFIEELFLLTLNKKEKNQELEKKTVEEIIAEFKKQSEGQKQNAVSFIRGGQYTPSPGDKLSIEESAPNNAVRTTRESVASSRNSIEFLLREGLARLREEEKEAAVAQQLKNSSGGRLSADRLSLKASLEIKKLLEGSRAGSGGKKEELLESSNLVASARIGGTGFEEEVELDDENGRESIVLRRSTELVEFIQNKLGLYKDPDSQESVKEALKSLTSSANRNDSYHQISPDIRMGGQTDNKPSDDKLDSHINQRDINEELANLYDKVLREASEERRPSGHRSFASYIKEHSKITEFKTQDQPTAPAQEKENKGVAESKKLSRNSDVLVSFAAGSFNNNQNVFENTESDVKFMLGGLYNRLIENIEK